MANCVECGKQVDPDKAWVSKGPGTPTYMCTDCVNELSDLPPIDDEQVGGSPVIALISEMLRLEDEMAEALRMKDGPSYLPIDRLEFLHNEIKRVKDDMRALANNQPDSRDETIKHLCAKLVEYAEDMELEGCPNTANEMREVARKGMEAISDEDIRQSQNQIRS